MSKSNFRSLTIIGACMAMIAVPMSASAADKITDHPNFSFCVPDLGVCVSVKGKVTTKMGKNGSWSTKEDLTYVYTMTQGANVYTQTVETKDKQSCKNDDPNIVGTCVDPQKVKSRIVESILTDDGMTCTIVTTTTEKRVKDGIVTVDTVDVTTEPCA